MGLEMLQPIEIVLETPAAAPPAVWTIPSSTETWLSGASPRKDQEIEEERSTVPVIA